MMESGYGEYRTVAASPTQSPSKSNRITLTANVATNGLSVLAPGFSQTGREQFSFELSRSEPKQSGVRPS
jgi:hypothetical protein